MWRSEHTSFQTLRFATRFERKIFLRYGEYEHNSDDTLQVFTTRGKQQANIIGRVLDDHVRLARFEPVVIYHSTLTRSKQTTEIIKSYMQHTTKVYLLSFEKFHSTRQGHQFLE